jgi:quercetin dioxygenase-like cupin family protein
VAYPDVKMTCVKNLWVRQMHFKNIGDANEKHVHNYDHITLLAYGSVRVHIDGHQTDFKAPQMIYVQKGKSHHIEALEPNTVACCIHALRDKDSEEIIDPDQVPLGVDLFEQGLVSRL